MANLRIDDAMTKSSSAYALETESLFNDFSTGNRSIWGQQASEDREFRLGKQWSDEDRKILEERS